MHVVLTWDHALKIPITEVIGLFTSELEAKEHITEEGWGEVYASIHPFHCDYNPKGKFVVLVWDYKRVVPVTEVTGFFTTYHQARAHIAHQGWEDYSSIHELHNDFKPGVSEVVLEDRADLRTLRG